MKESMRKPVLFFMDLMVVFLAVILTIELIANAGFTFPFMETGHRTSAFLRRIQGQESVSYTHLDVYKRQLFDTVKDDDVVKELQELDISNMTPMDAMNTLYRLQNKLKNRW